MHTLRRKNWKHLYKFGDRLLRLVAIGLVTIMPVVADAHGGGHGGGGGGHMGGGHMGGGHMGGSSFHGGSFYGGGMRVAPSHSFAPSNSGISRMPAASGINSGTAHSAFRVGTPNGSTARATTSWNNASHAQLQHINTNLSSAVKANAAVNHSLASAHLNSGALGNAKLGGLSSQGNAIRSNWNGNGNHAMQGNGWWTGRHCHGFGGFGLWGGFGYMPWLGFYPWWYWWGNPGWGYCNSYLGYGWNNGYYYGYGANGNVVYQNGQVLVDGQAVGTDAEYAQSAAELANVSPEDLKAVKPADWMPLGTFSWAISESEVDPSRVIQIAVSKNGLVSGTVNNRTSGNTYSVQGRVDKDTQRLAFTIGDDRNTVLETGIYNLTQDQTPVLCHFGLKETQTYMFVRLPEPEHEPGNVPANPGANPPAPPTPDAAAAAPADAAPIVAADAPPLAVPADSTPAVTGNPRER